ncbi:21498_t:CDS:2 [Entrophospora sp. SA101]|nr:21498_t:CDS:2 [Entrophospora sp. SA101]
MTIHYVQEYASNGTNKDEGSRFDWIFSVHDLGKETYWGHELALYSKWYDVSDIDYFDIPLMISEIHQDLKCCSVILNVHIAREEKLNDSSKEPWVAENRSPK